jgi:hypothetical protein
MADTKISALSAATTPLAGTLVFPIVQSGATVKATIADVQAAPVTAGTANGVQYLNASKVPTTGTGLVFDSVNLGLGATPTPPTACTNFELPYGATISSRSNTAAPQFAMMSNAVGDWYAATYKINGFATRYTQQGFDGTHTWSVAPSGVAGASIAFLPVWQITQAGNLAALVSGNGIDFSATPGTGTSELLSDYEEGTWTPTDGSGAGLVFTTQDARYTKVGRLVTISASITYPVTADASDAIIAGLPFTTFNGTSGVDGGGTSFTDSATALMFLIAKNTTSFDIRANAGGATRKNVNMSTLTIRFTLTYTAA